jgi:hypothetical protein
VLGTPGFAETVSKRYAVRVARLKDSASWGCEMDR